MPDRRHDIWIAPVSGGPSIRFTDEPGAHLQPVWSPDGTEIAFVSNRDGRNRIWIKGVSDGHPSGAARRLTSWPDWEMSPDWSADGRWFVYIAAGEEYSEAWIAPAGGNSPPRRITTSANAIRVRWDPSAPNNSRILIAATFGTPSLELRSARVDDGELSGFDPPVSFGSASAWGLFNVSASGRRIAFSQESVSGDIWVLEALDGSY